MRRTCSSASSAIGARPRFVCRTTPVALTTWRRRGSFRAPAASTTRWTRSPGSWPAAISSRACASVSRTAATAPSRGRAATSGERSSLSTDGSSRRSIPRVYGDGRNRGPDQADRARLLRRLRREVLGRAAPGARGRHRAALQPGPAHRPRTVRRRGRLPARRRARARLHARLLPADRRRPGDVRRDRRGERAQRRVRDGRPAAGGTLDRCVSRVAAARRGLGHPHGGGGEGDGGRRRCSPAGTRSARRSRSTASPSSAPCRPMRSGRRPAPSRATSST